MFKEFLRGERAQTTLEYILLAGGVMVVSVVIFSIYSSMSRSTATMLNESVGEKIDEISNIINDTGV